MKGVCISGILFDKDDRKDLNWNNFGQQLNIILDQN